MNPRKTPSFRLIAPGRVPEVVLVPMIAEAPRAGDSANKGPATIEISKAVELPSGTILEAAGPGYFIKAPTGTDREAVRRAVDEFLRSQKNKPR